MFLSRYLQARTNLWKKILVVDSFSGNFSSPLRKLSGVTSRIQSTCTCNKSRKNGLRKSFYLRESRICYSKLLDDGLDEFQSKQQEKELKRIYQLYPQPRVTLHELSTRTPQQIFDVQYKQHLVPHRKKMAQGDWTCTYAFVWPEKIKFESTAKSKRQAAEKAATQALLWLFMKKRIDSEGCPIYDKEVLNELKDTIDQPMRITVSDKMTERISKLWNEYESGIKPIYESVFEKAANKVFTASVSCRDSSLDEDDFSDEEVYVEDNADSSDTKTYVHPVYGKFVKPPTEAAIKRREKVLEHKLRKYEEERTPLPIDDYMDQITSTLEASRVVVVVGAAGCGKSSRAAAAALRARGAAVAAQPRRVAAAGLARRLAAELGEEVSGLN